MPWSVAWERAAFGPGGFYSDGPGARLWPARFFRTSVHVGAVFHAAIAALLSQELREPVACSEVQVEGVFIYPEASAATSDIAWLRSVYPGLHTLRSWLEEGGGLALCRRAVAHPSA